MKRLPLAGFGLGALIVLFGGTFRASTDNPTAHGQIVSQSPTQGPAGITAAGYPTTRTLSLATAYQATAPAKPATVTVNLSSAATLSLSGGSTNTATVVVGSTTGVATGTGAAVCSYANTNTGALTIGLNLSTVMTAPCTFALPANGYFAIRQTAGTVTITSAFDAAIG